MNSVGLLLSAGFVWHCRIIPCLAADTPIILFIKSCGGEGAGRWAGMHIHLCDCRQLTENVELEQAWGLASTLLRQGLC